MPLPWRLAENQRIDRLARIARLAKDWRWAADLKRHRQILDFDPAFFLFLFLFLSLALALALALASTAAAAHRSHPSGIDRAAGLELVGSRKPWLAPDWTAPRANRRWLCRRNRRRRNFRWVSPHA